MRVCSIFGAAKVLHSVAQALLSVISLCAGSIALHSDDVMASHALCAGYSLPSCAATQTRWVKLIAQLGHQRLCSACSQSCCRCLRQSLHATACCGCSTPMVSASMAGTFWRQIPCKMQQKVM